MDAKAVASVPLVDAAAEARVSYQVAHRWVLTGELRGERRRGRWFVHRDSLDALLREREAPTAA